MVKQKIVYANPQLRFIIMAYSNLQPCIEDGDIVHHAYPAGREGVCPGQQPPAVGPREGCRGVCLPHAPHGDCAGGGHGCQVWVYPPTIAEGWRIGREDTDVRYGFIPQQ